MNEINQKGNSLAMAGIVLVAIALRPALVSVGPALDSIQRYFGMSHFAAGALISIPDFLMGLLALPTPWLVKKLGRDNLIIGSLLLIAVSTLARAYVPGVSTLLFCTAGVGIGIAIAGTLLSGFVKANFPMKAAFVMGIYTMSLSLGSTLSALTTAPILKVSGSWRIATGLWSIPAIVGLIAWMFVAAKEKALDRSPSVTANYKIPWKSPVAWRIAFFFAFVNLLFYSLVAWTAPMYIEHGLSTSVAGYILGCFTFFFMLSSFIFGTFSKSRDRRVWLIGSSQVTLVGLIMMYLFPGALPFLFISITAVGLGGAFTLAMTLPLDNTIDSDETNTWTAFVLTIGYIIAAVGPILLGVIRDFTGSFQIPVLTLMGVSMGMILIAGTLKPKKLRFSDLYTRQHNQ